MIGVVVALGREAEILNGELKTQKRHTMFGKEVLVGTFRGYHVAVCISGVGKVNAAAGACAVLSLGAEKLLNFGVAGGLKPENTAVGKVYLIEKAVQYDFDCAEINGTSIGVLDGETECFLPLFCPDIPLERRILGTGDRFNDNAADHALLLSLGCGVRDMEAGAIAEVGLDDSAIYAKYAMRPRFAQSTSWRSFRKSINRHASRHRVILRSEAIEESRSTKSAFSFRGSFEDKLARTA